MTVLAVDTETTGTDFWHGCRPFMVSACDGKRNYVWQGRVEGLTRNVFWDEDDIFELQYRLDKADELVFHNTNFDMKALSTIGIQINHLWSKIQDTLIASHCVCSSDVHGLKELAVKYLRYPRHDEKDLQDAVLLSRQLNPFWKAKRGHPHFPAIKNGKFWKMDMWMEPELCKKYAIHDAQRTWLLWKVFKKGLQQDRLYDQYLFRRDLLKICYDMRETGIYMYPDKSKELFNHLTEQRELIRIKIQEESGAEYDINPAKTKSLRYLLFDVLELSPAEYTKTGEPSTRAQALDDLLAESDDPIVKLVKQWRTVDKKRSTLLSHNKWSYKNRLHSNINITGTHWTRQSSSDPNQQNFDKSMSYLYGPPKGSYWFYCDVVNVELCIWAYDAKAKALIEEFEKGESVHIAIAKALFPNEIEELGIEGFKKTKLYTKCKSGTFAKLYGGSDNKIDRTYGVANANQIIRAKLPQVAEYFDYLTETMKANCNGKHGYPCINTTQGYRLDVPWNAPHTVSSARIQGTAGLIVQNMMRKIVKDPYVITRGIALNQQVHDSLCLEIEDHPEEEFTNKYLLNKLQEFGREHLSALRLEYEIIRFDPKPQKLIDYRYTDKEIGNFKILLYKKAMEPLPTNNYHWFVDLQDKNDKKRKFTFEAQWRQEVLDIVQEFVLNEEDSEIPF